MFTINLLFSLHFASTFLVLPSYQLQLYPPSLLALTLSRNMMHTVFACLNRKISDVKVEVEQFIVTKAVYRAELTQKKSPSPSKAVKKSVRFADSEPTIMRVDNEKDFGKRSCTDNELGERAGIRVKVKMTKEEAARLLSKCKKGGVLEFKDVAHELVALPVNRVSVVSTCTKNDPYSRSSSNKNINVKS